MINTSVEKTNDFRCFMYLLFFSPVYVPTIIVYCVPTFVSTCVFTAVVHFLLRTLLMLHNKSFKSNEQMNKTQKNPAIVFINVLFY